MKYQIRDSLTFDELEAALERAHAEVVALAKRDKPWRMSIPAQDGDSDLVIGDALRHSLRLVKSLVKSLRVGDTLASPAPQTELCPFCNQQVPRTHHCPDFGGFNVLVERKGSEVMAPPPPAVDLAMRALKAIAEHGCERRTAPPFCPDEPGWSKDAIYTADRWCDTCIALEALRELARLQALAPEPKK